MPQGVIARDGIVQFVEHRLRVSHLHRAQREHVRIAGRFAERALNEMRSRDAARAR